MRNLPKDRAAHSTAFSAVILLGIVAALYFMREILIPLAFALTLTFLLTPAVTFLQKMRLGRVPAVILVLLVSIAGTSWAGWSIGNQLLDVVNQLPTYRDNIHAKIQSLRLSQKGSLGRAAQNVKDIGQELSTVSPAPAAVPVPPSQPRKRNAPVVPTSPVPVEMVQPSAGWLTYFRDLTSPFVRPIAITGIVLIFTVFMLIEREDLRNRLLRLVGLSQLNVMTQALDDAAKRVSRYLLMQFLVNAAFGVVVGVGLYFIGLPNPALWAVVAGILRIVPYVGTFVAAILPFLLSFAVFNSWLPPLLVFVLFAMVELIVGNFIEPWLYGTHTGISSLALLVTAVFWTILWGPAGLVLSTPLTVCVVVLGRYVPHLSFLHVLLGDEAALEVEAHLYQRLLAMDQVEARSIVDVFLKSRTLLELYDLVFIPALTLAEQDRHRGAIDRHREEFLFLSLNEMVAEFSDHVPPPPEGEGNAEAKPEPRRPANLRILCLPAHDAADELAAAMLAQILEQDGYPALVLPLGPPLHETVSMLNVGETDVLCISALPPYAFAPSRRMVKQLRDRFPKLTVLVCIWGFTGDTEKATARFERIHPEHFVTSIGQAVELIQKLDQPPSVTPA